MARILNPEIKQLLIDNNQLAADFCDHMKVKFISLDQMLRRNNKKLTHADNIIWLSNRLKKSIDDLLTEQPELESKVPA